MHIRIVHRSRGSLAFQLADDDGSMALAGAPQRDVDACVLAIRELIASLRERNAVVHSSKAGQHRWTLRGERDRVLAESAPRPSLAEAEALLAELQRWAADETQFRVRFPPEQRSASTDIADIGVAVRYDLGEPSCSGHSGLELLRRTRDDLHCAHFNDADGRPLLYLRGFTGAYLRDEQVRALLQALPQRRRYRRQDADGRSYFVVTARNGGELARSRWFDRPGECDEAIDRLVRVAPAAAREQSRPTPSAATSGSYLLGRPATSDAPGFEAFRHSDRKHYFHLNGPDGAPLLYSHGYGSARELDAGMRTLIRVASIRDHYHRRLDPPPIHFVILAGNGRELARSRDFTDPAELDAAILWLLQELIGLGTLAGIRRRETVHFAVPHDDSDPEPTPPVDTPESEPVHAWRTIADRTRDPAPTPPVDPPESEPVHARRTIADRPRDPEPAPTPVPEPHHTHAPPRTGTIPRRVEALLAELRVERSPHHAHPPADRFSSPADDPPHDPDAPPPRKRFVDEPTLRALVPPPSFTPADDRPLPTTSTPAAEDRPIFAPAVEPITTPTIHPAGAHPAPAPEQLDAPPTPPFTDDIPISTPVADDAPSSTPAPTQPQITDDPTILARFADERLISAPAPRAAARPISTPLIADDPTILADPRPIPAPAEPTISVPAEPTISAPAEPTISAPAEPTISAPAEPTISAPSDDEPEIAAILTINRSPSRPTVRTESSSAPHKPAPDPPRPTPEPRPAEPRPTVEPRLTVEPRPTVDPPRPAQEPRPQSPAPPRDAPKLNLPPPPNPNAPATLPRRSDVPKTTPPRAPIVASAPLYPRPAPAQSPHPATITAPLPDPTPIPRSDPSSRPITPQRPIPTASPSIPHPTESTDTPDPSDHPRSHAIPDPRHHPRSHAIPDAPDPLTPRTHPRSHAIPDTSDPPLTPRTHPRSRGIPDPLRSIAPAREPGPEAAQPRRFGETLHTALATPSIARHSDPLPSLLPAAATPTPAPRPADLLPTTPPTATTELPRPTPPIASPRPRPARPYALYALLAVLFALFVILVIKSPWSSAPASADTVAEDPPVPPITRASDPDDPPPLALAPDLPLACPAPAEADPALGVLVAPFQPLADRPIRLLAATLADESPLVLQLLGPDGRTLPDLAVSHEPGVPSAAIATTTLPAGSYTLAVGRDQVGLRCHDFTVATTNLPAPAPESAAPWPGERAWTPAEEALHSAWLRALFADPAPSLARLDLATRDPDKNLLHDALGLAEDSDRGLELRPDHADLPYTLRAYWAWKRRLPFAYRSCAPGPANGAARCPAPRSNLTPEPDAPVGALARAQRFFQRSLPRAVQPANLRTALDDAASDFYPVALARHVLRPGTVYADPYGHVLVLVGQRPATPEHPGVLLAVASHPDGSITREHFWPGSFLHDPDPALGGSGFRHFRPVVQRGAEVIQLGDDAITGSLEHGDLWTGHATLSADEFHDRVDTLVGIATRDPFLVQRDLVDALARAVQDRVVAVEQGAAHLRSQTRPIPLPPGLEIFATSGPWERLASPGRDLRLRTALTALRRFVDRVRSNPAAYGTPDGERGDPILTQLVSERERLLANHAFTYRRSDGSQQSLTLTDLVHRVPALEVAYNPNDCPEHRWGAPAGSAEASTCTRRAPHEQQLRMEAYRHWFRERPTPPRPK